jgi:hypothetical protein
VKAAFSRANRLLGEIGFPPLEVGDCQEADNFLRCYMSTQFTAPLRSVRFKGKPIAAYAFDDRYNCNVYVIPLTKLFMQPDSKEAGFALAWRALYENFIFDKRVFSVEVNLHSPPNSPTRCYVLKVTPRPIIGKFDLIAFYNLTSDSFRIIVDVFNQQGLLVGECEARNDFSVIRDYLLHPLALLSL